MSLSEARKARCRYCADGVYRDNPRAHPLVQYGDGSISLRPCTAPSDEELYAELEKQVAELKKDRGMEFVPADCPYCGKPITSVYPALDTLKQDQERLNWLDEGAWTTAHWRSVKRDNFGSLRAAIDAAREESEQCL